MVSLSVIEDRGISFHHPRCDTTIKPQTVSALPRAIRLAELTTQDSHAAAAAFAADAHASEREQVARLPPTLARLYVHAHGALRLLPLRRYRSLSYASGRAWAALADVPVGLDIVAAVNNAPLDCRFVTPHERAIVDDVGFPPWLTVWAAKEAAAKLFGDVRREPEGWRLTRRGAGWCINGVLAESAAIAFLHLAPGLLASLAIHPTCAPGAVGSSDE